MSQKTIPTPNEVRRMHEPDTVVNMKDRHYTVTNPEQSSIAMDYAIRTGVSKYDTVSQCRAASGFEVVLIFGNNVEDGFWLSELNALEPNQQD